MILQSWKAATTPLAPLTIFLASVMLATVVIPTAGLGTGPLGATPVPTSGANPVQTSREGTPEASTSGSPGTLSIAPATAVVTSGTAQVLTAVLTPAQGLGEPTLLSISWSLPASGPGVLGATDQPTTSLYTSTVEAPVLLVVEAQASAYVEEGFAAVFFTAAATASITVVPPLSVSTIAIAPDPASPGEPVTLSTKVGGGEAPYTIAVAFGDGETATFLQSSAGTATISHTYAAGSFEPTELVTDASGTAVPSSAAGSALVSSTLGAAIVAPTGADEGSSVTFVASVAGGSGSYTYLWSDSWGDASYSPGDWTQTPSRTGALTVRLTVTDSEGQSAVAPPVTVSVEPPPTLTLSSPVSTADVGTPFPLVLGIQGGVAPYEVVWTPGESSDSLSSTFPQAGDFTEPYAFPQSGEITTTADLRDALGVEFTTTARLGTVVALPRVSVASVPEVPVESRPFALTAMVSGGVAPYQWSWSFGGPVSPSTPMTGTLSSEGTVAWNGTYTSAGGLVAHLNVVDASGGFSLGTLDLSVVAPLLLSLSSQSSRGEEGVPLALTMGLSGGAGPYAVTLAASDGESSSFSLSSAGSHVFQLTPRDVGNLTVVVEAADAIGQVASYSFQLSIAAGLRVELSTGAGAVDAGGHLLVSVLLLGGWSPYSGELTVSDGRVVPFQGPSSTVAANLTFPVAGPLQLSAEATDALGSSATDTVAIDVDSAPWAEVVPASRAADEGVPLSFLVNAGGGTGVFSSLSLDFGDGSFSSTWSSTHTYTRPGTFLATATVVDSAGGVAISASQPVTVVPAPQVLAVQVAPGADAGLADAFASEVSFGTGPFAYLWSFGDGTQSALPDPSHVYLAPGTYHVQLTITDSMGASATAPVLNTTVAAPAALSVSVNRTSLEADIPALFQADVLGGAAPFQVTWHFGDGTVASGIDLNHSYAAPGAYTIEATLTDAAGGTATMAIGVSVAPPLEAVAVEATPSHPEVGIPITLAEPPLGGVGPCFVTWRSGGAVASGWGLTSWTVLPNASGTLSGTVSVADSAGGSSSTSFALAVAAALTVAPRVLPAIPEAGHPFLMDAGVLGGASPYSFSWSVPAQLGGQQNSSEWAGTAASSGDFVVGLVVADASGSMVHTTFEIHVAPALSVVFGSDALSADAGLPTELPLEVEGGAGPVSVLLTTPQGQPVNGSSPVVFTSPGVFLVRAVATDQDGAVASAQANVTVDPPPVLMLLSELTTVAVGATVPWQAEVVGGSAPYALRWQVAGVGSWEGPEANLTLRQPGTYSISLTAEDSTGATATLSTNATAVPDTLSVDATLTASSGLLPFRPFLSVEATSGTGSVKVTVEMDGLPVAAPHLLEDGEVWALPLDVLSGGPSSVTVLAGDALGMEVQRVLNLSAYPPLSDPLLSPDPLHGQAGRPLSLSANASTSTDFPGSSATWTWWGPGVLASENGSGTFLENRSGIDVIDLSGSLQTSEGTVLQNLTLPLPVLVGAAPAVKEVVVTPEAPAMAGANSTVLVEALDAFGNLNQTATDNVSLREVEGASGSTAFSSAMLAEGVADLELDATHAGSYDYAFEGSLPHPSDINLSWVADPSRTVLRLVSWQRLGSTLVLNVSVLDVYGNPLSGVSVTAQSPDGPSVQGEAEDGNLSLILPGAAGVSEVDLLGPDGAETTVVLPAGGDPGTSGSVLLLVAVLLVGAVAAGLFALWGRRRRGTKAPPPSSEGTPPSLVEAKGALEEIVRSLPGEDRASLLQLAEEHGIAREEAEEALEHLEREKRVRRRTEEDGRERWDPAEDPPRAGDRPADPEADVSSEGVGRRQP